MVFKKMLSAFGVGGPSVDTVLANPNTRPGETLEGQVNLVGGEAPANIEQIVVGLVTRVEIERGNNEHGGVMEFHRQVVGGPLQLAPKQQLSIPFQVPVPWETPITDLYGQRLPGMTMGLRTELAIARAVDKGDLDQVSVHPLLVQERILQAFLQLGFRLKSADLEQGRIHGVPQMLPFYQEIEFFAAPQYAQVVNELELTFVTNPNGIDVVLECDKRGGFRAPGPDAFGHYQVGHGEADGHDWAQVVDGWLRETIERFGAMRAQAYGAPQGFGPQGYGAPHAAQPGYPPQGVPPQGYPAPHAAPPGYRPPGAPAYGAPHAAQGYGAPQGYGPPNQYGAPQRRSGPGMGGIVAGAALGAAGGMLAGHMIGNAFDGGEEQVAEAAGDLGGAEDFGGGDFGGDFGGGDFGGFEEF
ncbi:SpoOM family protein [Micromonospora craterilacus]|uniref:SpoOM family protein n=1 Tax=Micromonospora craterilacus TaxID=1655439 RepID=A0A2W2E9B9_9ACTN|nr:sporulation protein [Micromonospora craterilacus]PZG08568.1 SpoOM family protein [Micromonospora craterilacus]